jgi:hypothetical protein
MREKSSWGNFLPDDKNCREGDVECGLAAKVFGDIVSVSLDDVVYSNKSKEFVEAIQETNGEP